jgi:hypothetical protein
LKGGTKAVWDAFGLPTQWRSRLGEGVIIGKRCGVTQNISGVGRPGEGIMRVDGKEVARKKMEKTIPITLAWDESQDIGSDTLTGVNDADYQVPFTFNGKIDKISLDINRPQLSAEDIKKLEEGQRKASDN